MTTGAEVTDAEIAPMAPASLILQSWCSTPSASVAAAIRLSDDVLGPPGVEQVTRRPVPVEVAAGILDGKLDVHGVVRAARGEGLPLRRVDHVVWRGDDVVEGRAAPMEGVEAIAQPGEGLEAGHRSCVAHHGAVDRQPPPQQPSPPQGPTGSAVWTDGGRRVPTPPPAVRGCRHGLAPRP